MGESPEDDNIVSIQKGKKLGEPHVITVNCPDKIGLGCDLCRIVLEYGLEITKGDVSTDGIWCYIVLWVFPHSTSVVRWSHLKNHLLSVCPSCSMSFLYISGYTRSRSTSSPMYMLKFFSLNRKGLLYDVTQILCEIALTIQRVKVMTTPDGRVLDLFFITDNMGLLHTKERQDETYKQLHIVLGESCMSCELGLAGHEYDCRLGISSLSHSIEEELFRSELSDKEVRSQALSPDLTRLKEADITVDNSLSPAHTLLQIQCVDHKGLLYDVMRTLKDSSIKISFGRFSPQSKGYRDLDLFIQLISGEKVVYPDKQTTLCSRLKLEMLHPLRVIITNRGPDTELVVANPVELSGAGRPRVFYDVTLALKALGICVFSADIGRYSTSENEWEVYRFLMDEDCEFQLSSSVARDQIVDKVRRTLMGW